MAEVNMNAAPFNDSVILYAIKDDIVLVANKELKKASFSPYSWRKVNKRLPDGVLVIEDMDGHELGRIINLVDLEYV